VVVAVGTIDALAGGDVQGTLPSGESIEVRVPPGAVATAVTVTITAFATSPITPPEGEQVVGAEFALAAVDASGTAVLTFTAPVTLTFGYPAAVADPATLVVAFFDATTGSWQTLATSVDALDQVLQATTTHFTTFAVLQPVATPTVTLSPTATAVPYPTYACPGLDPTRRLGDINGDGQVNLTDFSIFAGDYGKDTSQGAVLNSSYSDMNCDGTVDLTDFSIFAGQYGQ
jgi:hypothetical protein